jgi:hypothetical protein
MHPYIPLTDTQHNALTGSMLGDGHLVIGLNNINAALMIGRSVKDQEYLKYEYELFTNFIPARHINGLLYDSSIDKRTGKSRNGCYFSTIASPTFTPYHNLWYKLDEGKYKKIIPSNLELNAQIIAHWIADDGSIDFNKLPYRLRLELATYGFTQDEVIFLAELLNKRYNEEFLVRQKNRGDKTYFIIKAYDSACRVLFADIDPYFKMDRKRIWDKPESRFWTDQPDRQKSKIKDFAARKEMLNQMIAIGDDFRLIDLARQLGYIYDGQVDSKSVNRLLKPYLTDGLIVKDMDRFNNNTITIRIVK